MPQGGSGGVIYLLVRRRTTLPPTLRLALCGVDTAGVDRCDGRWDRQGTGWRSVAGLRVSARYEHWRSYSNKHAARSSLPETCLESKARAPPRGVERTNKHRKWAELAEPTASRWGATQPEIITPRRLWWLKVRDPRPGPRTHIQQTQGTQQPGWVLQQHAGAAKCQLSQLACSHE